MNSIEKGDEVLLYLDKKRTYKVKINSEKEFHTHKGYLKLEELIGKPFGSPIQSSLNVRFYALKPLIRDQIMKTDRRTQVLYPKDIGYILLKLGIGPGSRVVEAGTGSGALTMALANAVRPTGKIYTYEINEKFQKISLKNIEKAELLPYVDMKLEDITKGIMEIDIDAIALDMSTPWLIISHSWKALTGSGVFLSFSPTIEQVMKTVSSLQEHPFIEIETIEMILRKITVDRNRTRPETLMIGHSGYITTARKVFE